MAIDREALAREMGEGDHMRPKAIVVPMVSLHGEKGVVRYRGIKEGKLVSKEEVKDLGESFSGVIVRIRSQLSMFKPLLRQSSNEYDGAKEVLRLWETKGKDGSRQQIAEGSVGKLREQFQELRAVRWLYMLTSGSKELIKFKVRGSGLFNLFAYFDELKNSDKHSYEVVTKIAGEKRKNEALDKEYFAPTFAIEKVLTDEQIEEFVQPEIQRLSKTFKELALAYSSAPGGEELAAEEVMDLETAEEIPVIDLEDEGKAEDIPF